VYRSVVGLAPACVAHPTKAVLPIATCGSP
jgi:hypothetical protein